MATVIKKGSLGQTELQKVIEEILPQTNVAIDFTVEVDLIKLEEKITGQLKSMGIEANDWEIREVMVKAVTDGVLKILSTSYKLPPENKRTDVFIAHARFVKKPDLI